MRYAVIVIIGVLILLGAWFLLVGDDALPSGGNETSGMTEDPETAVSGESAPVGGAGAAVSVDIDAEVEGDIKEFILTGKNFEFSQEEIRVNKGDRVRIVFTSTAGAHNWTVDKFSAATQTVGAGGTSSVEFSADEAGVFEYYCSVGNHRALGMVGNLVVE